MNRNGFDLSEIFSRIPQLNQFRPDNFEIEILAGFTNHNYRLKNDEFDWVLRIPKQQTNRYINRNHEAHNLCLAAGLGLAKDSQWCDESGLSLTATLSQTHTARSEDLKNAANVEHLLTAIRRLHNCERKFLGELDLSLSLSQYYELIPNNYIQHLKPYYRKALAGLEQLRENPRHKVPTHSDLVRENLLIENSGKIWLIDWEYSAMASPYWDLATLCNTTRLDREQSQNLLDTYNAPGATLTLNSLLRYQFALQLMTICWMLTFSQVEIETEIRHLTRLES